MQTCGHVQQHLSQCLYFVCDDPTCTGITGNKQDYAALCVFFMRYEDDDVRETAALSNAVRSGHKAVCCSS